MPSISLKLDDSFLKKHGGRIIADPDVALIELVANCSDSGSNNVDITWPDNINGTFSIEDDGHGLSKTEFESIWRTIDYNRFETNPEKEVITSNGNNKRKIYGKNGKGRLGVFCFASTYFVESSKDGKCTKYEVTEKNDEGNFIVDLVDEFETDKHGLRISCTVNKIFPKKEDEVRELIGSNFVADPSFVVKVNGKIITHTDLEDSSSEYPIVVPSYGEILLKMYETKKASRTTKQHGVAWWVNGRRVGTPSWKCLDGTYIDGRTSEAKKYTFVVEADILEDEVESDWSGFIQNEKSVAVINAVNAKIVDLISTIFSGTRREIKKKIINKNRQLIKRLPRISKDNIGRFIDEIMIKCPTMNEGELDTLVSVLAKLEESRYGYELLTCLNEESPEGLDRLTSLLNQWTSQEMKIVLDELQQRLDIIEQLETLSQDPTTKELQIMQPLFENGLWIFGDKYETCEYTSNRTLLTIFKKLFKDSEIESSKNRPDFVIVPGSSYSVYTKDKYDENGDVEKIGEVLVVELKKGGFTIGTAERRQAEDYISEIRKSRRITDDAEIKAFVLGDKVSIDCKASNIGGDHVEPMSYTNILSKAHKRTLNLLNKIRSAENIEPSDIDQILSIEQSSLADFDME